MKKSDYTASQVVFVILGGLIMYFTIGLIYYITQIPSVVILSIFLLGNVYYFILSRIEMKLMEKYGNRA